MCAKQSLAYISTFSTARMSVFNGPTLPMEIFSISGRLFSPNTARNKNPKHPLPEGLLKVDFWPHSAPVAARIEVGEILLPQGLREERPEEMLYNMYEAFGRRFKGSK
jgi:hypothetical protein